MLCSQHLFILLLQNLVCDRGIILGRFLALGALFGFFECHGRVLASNTVITLVSLLNAICTDLETFIASFSRLVFQS